MTEPHNPLMARRAQARRNESVALPNGQPVPIEIDAYCAWLNSLRWCQGKWQVSGTAPNRYVERRAA